MGDDDWIIVPNWDKFQHYSDRNPPWIKVYLELNHNQDWLDLSDLARGLLVRCWLLYAASRGQLRVGQVRGQGWSKNHARHLESLNHAGFIEFSASKPLALARARPETEKETDLLKGSNGKTSASRIAAMIDNGALANPELLDLELLAAGLPAETANELRARLGSQLR